MYDYALDARTFLTRANQPKTSASEVPPIDSQLIFAFGSSCSKRIDLKHHLCERKPHTSRSAIARIAVIVGLCLFRGRTIKRYDGMNWPNWSSSTSSLKTGNHGSKRVEASVPGLTAEEADWLAPPVLADYAPWVVPLTVRPNGEDPTDTADD